MKKNKKLNPLQRSEVRLMLPPNKVMKTKKDYDRKASKNAMRKGAFND